MAFASNAPLANLRRVASGLISSHPLKRIHGLEVLLSYLLNRLPPHLKAEHFHFAPQLTIDHMPNARLYPSREMMLHLLPSGGRVAEIGTDRGAFSERIAAICQPEELHLFDLDFSILDEDRVRAAFRGKIHKHCGDSSTSLMTLPPNSFDWLYVDGDHTYLGVQRDLAASHIVLKPGGFLMCNDYTSWDVSSAQPYGVAKAVNEFCIAEDYEVVGLALERAGYHDILLRKPPHPARSTPPASDSHTFADARVSRNDEPTG